MGHSAKNFGKSQGLPIPAQNWRPDHGTFRTTSQSEGERFADALPTAGRGGGKEVLGQQESSSKGHGHRFRPKISEFQRELYCESQDISGTKLSIPMGLTSNVDIRETVGYQRSHWY